MRPERAIRWAWRRRPLAGAEAQDRWRRDHAPLTRLAVVRPRRGFRRMRDADPQGELRVEFRADRSEPDSTAAGDAVWSPRRKLIDSPGYTAGESGPRRTTIGSVRGESIISCRPVTVKAGTRIRTTC